MAPHFVEGQVGRESEGRGTELGEASIAADISFAEVFQGAVAAEDELAWEKKP